MSSHSRQPRIDEGTHQLDDKEPDPVKNNELALSRRGVLGVGAGIVSAFAAGQLALRATPSRAQQATPQDTDLGADLIEPEVRASQNGLLDTTLEARLGPTTVNGQRMTSRVYEGSFPGPTLRVRPGDTLRVRVVNELDDATNLHTHGFHVSPEGNSDNVFVHIMPGETFDYEYQIPATHPAGLYWYHPHVHGDTNEQVIGGMAGAIVVEGGLDDIPEIASLTDRLLLLQSTQFDDDHIVTPVGDQTNKSQVRYVNGQVNPSIRIRPGEMQRWRIANISANTFYLLALEGHLLHQIAKDGNPQSVVWTREQILMAPGERVEVLVQAAAAGNYELRTLLWGTGFQSQPDVVLATMVVEGDAVDPTPLSTTLIPFDDLSNAEIDNRREITFQVVEDPDGPHFLIDGQEFDENRVDQTVKLNATEEWVITNASDEWHPFHIHINEFQVVAINGEPVTVHGWEDTRGVPPQGSITIRSQFLDFTGRYVYHCHILFHEDGGMMGVVEVVDE